MLAGILAELLWLSLLRLAAPQTCAAPDLGGRYDVSSCSGGLERCSSCNVTCAAGFSSAAGPGVGTLSCLTYEDLQLNATQQCQVNSSSEDVHFFTRSWCGVAACCPAEPLRGAGCENRMDQLMHGQCDALLQQGYTCEEHFCPGCGGLAGQCDKLCGFGNCGTCGDCFRVPPDSPGGPKTCDDGNTVSGDGCSSDCLVEDEYVCRRGEGPGPAPDICERCNDVDGWTDALGFTCEDYRTFDACDNQSLPTDPLAVGGRKLHTPSYYKYIFAYDLAVTRRRPLRMRFTIRAATGAHLFVGRPGLRGFEAIISGWENSQSTLRKYPSSAVISNRYGTWLDADHARSFWLEYNYRGDFSLGAGEEYGKGLILGGDAAPRQTHSVEGWGMSSPTLLDQLWISTGYGADGDWSFRIDSGTAHPRIKDMTNRTSRLDATEACCACGRMNLARPCDLKDAKTIATSVQQHPTVPPASGGRLLQDVARRMTASIHFVTDPVPMGSITPDGFTLRITLGGCGGETVCSLNAIVVAERVAEKVSVPFTRVWPQLRKITCRLTSEGWAANVSGLVYWEATGCELTSGSRYSAFLHLHGGSMDVLANVSFELPPPPTGMARLVEFTDEDPNSGFAGGLVTIMGAADETGILQYKLYWSRGGGVKVEHELALAATVNTYASGGLRNVQSNECLFNDCQWKMHRAQSHRRRGRFIILHDTMRTCMCFRYKALEAISCPPELFQNDQVVVDHPDSYREVLRDGQVVQLDITSVPDRVPLPSDCLWKHDDVLINTTIETRLENIRYAMCLCQKPLKDQYGEDGEVLPSRGSASRELVIGRFCRLASFGETLGNTILPTTGYCEWTNLATDPTTSANPSADAGMSSMQSLSTAVPVQGRSGVPAWLLTGEQGLMVDSTIQVPASHTFAAWVHLQGFRGVDPTNHPGIVALFNATTASGAAAPCLILSQRTRVHDKNPICPDDQCDTEQLQRCCTSTTTTSTTTTSTTTTRTTATTSTTGENWTDNSTNVTYTTTTTTATTTTTTTTFDCNCVCVWPEPPNPSGYEYTLDGKMWTLGTDACGSHTPWDSGFDLSTDGGSSGWVLVAAVGSGDADGKGETVYYASVPERPDVFSFQEDFVCYYPGCLASTFLRDVPRDQQQTCSLSVVVSVPNCTVGTVESIVIWGGNPTRRYSIRSDCRPGCNTPLNFGCVRSHGVDDIVGGVGASRTIQVDVKLAYHTDVAGINGTAIITCRRLHLSDKFAPPSGSLRKVGVAGRTCAGSFLSSIGTSSGMSVGGAAPQTLVSQAWAWDRILSDEELKALYHSTRLRYYPYYYATLGNVYTGGSQEVITDHPEVVITQRLRCRSPVSAGCVPRRGDRKPLQGLPSEYHARCQLTVAVAITDFSDPSETVEYIRLIDVRDEENYITVSTNCWPARDNAPTEFFNCLYNEDVSQSTLRNAYIFNGEVDIEIVLSSEVDAYTTAPEEGGNVLDAQVTMRCQGVQLTDHIEAFAAIDTDNDGFIMREETEIAGVSNQVFFQTDTDNDEILTFTEFKKIPLERYHDTWGWYQDPKTDRRRTILGRKGETFEKVAVPADTLEIMVVSASDQGEGGAAAIPFNDRVNGFRVLPFIIGEPTATAVAIFSEPSDPDGLIWIHALVQPDAEHITARDVANGLPPGLDVCSAGKWTWPAEFFFWAADNTLTGCKFEINVPYVLLVYVDRRQEPWGGGTLAKVDLLYTGPIRYIVPGEEEPWLPKLRALEAVFEDNDDRVGRINGTLTITRAYYEDDITHYYVFWGYSQSVYSPDGFAQGTVEEMAKIEATGADEYTVVLGGPNRSDALCIPCVGSDCSAECVACKWCCTLEPARCRQVTTLLIVAWNDNITEYGIYIPWWDAKIPKRKARPAQLRSSDRRYANENWHGIYDLSRKTLGGPTQIMQATASDYGYPPSTEFVMFDFKFKPNILAGRDTVVDIAIVAKGTEHLARAAEDYRALDVQGPNNAEIGCHFRWMLGRGVASVELSTQQVEEPRACILKPGKEYALVTNLAVMDYQESCPCSRPCFCIGELTTSVQVYDANATTPTRAEHSFFTPDTTAPVTTMQCNKMVLKPGYLPDVAAFPDESCQLDFSLNPKITLAEPGSSFPAMALCAACRAGSRRRYRLFDAESGVCIRNSDSKGHRSWRIRIPKRAGNTQCKPAGNTTGTTWTVRIEQLAFYLLSDKTVDGELLENTSNIFQTASQFSGPDSGLNHSIVFQGNESESLELDTTSSDVFIGLDFGTAFYDEYINAERQLYTNGVPIMKVRVLYSSPACAAKEVHLERSDDGDTWLQHGLARTDDDVFDSIGTTRPIYEERNWDRRQRSDMKPSFGSTILLSEKFPCHGGNFVRGAGFDQMDRWKSGGTGRIDRKPLDGTTEPPGIGYAAYVRPNSESDATYFMYQDVIISVCAADIDALSAKITVTGDFWSKATPAPTPLPTPVPPDAYFYEYYYYDYFEGTGNEANVRMQVMFYQGLGADAKEMVEHRWDSGPTFPGGKWVTIGVFDKVVPVGVRMVRINFTTWEQRLGWSSVADNFNLEIKIRPNHLVALHPGAYTDQGALVHANLGWQRGVAFPTAWVAEGPGLVPIRGLTAGQSYQLMCYSLDSDGNDRTVGPLDAETRDSRGPEVAMHNITYTDFTANVVVTMTDPGGGYPAITNCFARESSDAGLPDMDLMKSKNQECSDEMKLPAAPVPNGRANYVEVVSARADQYGEPHFFRQHSWANYKPQVLRSCGLRHEGAYGPGGCRTAGRGLQKAEVRVVIKAGEEAYVFIGGKGRGAMGYEVVFGDLSNKMNSLRKGFASADFNDDLPLPQMLKTSGERDTPDHRRRRQGRDGPDRGGEILDADMWRVFWISIDPESGYIRVGEGDSFLGRMVIEYWDKGPVQTLDHVYVGLGYRSGGENPGSDGIFEGGIGFGYFYLCPRVLNLALGREADSSDQQEGLLPPFGASPGKMVDGQIGDNTFCEYCKGWDYQHVCAATRKGSLSRPWIRVTLDDKFRIHGVRLVVPTDGHPNQRYLDVWLGADGARRMSRCKLIPDAGGDHYYTCDDFLLYGEATKASSVSVYGDANYLADLPDTYGIRVCELEVYEYIEEVPSKNILYMKGDHYNKWKPPFFTPSRTAGAPIELWGLRPNEPYDLFCYAEDSRGNGGFSELITVTTTDTTPPRVRMAVTGTTQREITVDVNVHDPGNAYPVLGRCAATFGGVTPQEHDVYFEHRFWRARFDVDVSSLPEECGGFMRTKPSLFFESHSGEPLPGRMMFPSGTSMEEPDEVRVTETTFEVVGQPCVDRSPVHETCEFYRDDPAGYCEIGKMSSTRRRDYGGDAHDNCRKTCEYCQDGWTPPLAIPIAEPFIAKDMMGEHPLAKMIEQHGGSIYGDLVIALMWDSADDLEFQLTVPGNTWAPITTEVNDTIYGGGFDVNCQAHTCQTAIQSASWLLAVPGEYELGLLRRDADPDEESFRQVDFTVFVRMCGKDYSHQLALSNDTHNVTFGKVGFNHKMGCHRRDAAKWTSWQSSVLNPIWPSTTRPPEILPALDFPAAPGRVMGDNDFSTCTETGGSGYSASGIPFMRPTLDARPWWRLDLGEHLHVKGVWLMGHTNLDRFNTSAATIADVYVVPPNVSAEELPLDLLHLNASELVLNRTWAIEPLGEVYYVDVPVPQLHLGRSVQADTRDVTLTDAVLTGDWVWIVDEQGDQRPSSVLAKATRSSALFATSAISRWWVCGLLQPADRNESENGVRDLGCVDIEVRSIGREGHYATALTAFRTLNYTGDIDDAESVDAAYYERENISDSNTSLIVSSINWTISNSIVPYRAAKEVTPAGPGSWLLGAGDDPRAVTMNSGTVQGTWMQDDRGTPTLDRIPVDSPFARTYDFDPSNESARWLLCGVVSRNDGGAVQIAMGDNAGALRKDDGAVVTWGHEEFGGDSSAMASQLASGVIDIVVGGHAGAAHKDDGSVVLWGHNENGAAISDVTQLTSDVVDVKMGLLAGAALKADGSVATWGSSRYFDGDGLGGDGSSAIASQLTRGNKDVIVGPYAGAVHKTDGGVVTWGLGTRDGSSHYAGDGSAVASQLLFGVAQVDLSDAAYARRDSGIILSGAAARKDDGTVIAWGDPAHGGNVSDVVERLTYVVDIDMGQQAGAALKVDGSVVTWGSEYHGGDSSAVASVLTSGVRRISMGGAGAAVKDDGSVVTWGRDYFGGDSSAVASQLTSGVVDVVMGPYAGAARRADGALVTWGMGRPMYVDYQDLVMGDNWGGDSSAVASQLSSGVVDVVIGAKAGAARRQDGSVVTWGSREYGGSLSAVASQLARSPTMVLACAELEIFPDSAGGLQASLVESFRVKTVDYQRAEDDNSSTSLDRSTGSGFDALSVNAAYPERAGADLILANLEWEIVQPAWSFTAPHAVRQRTMTEPRVNDTLVNKTFPRLTRAFRLGDGFDTRAVVIDTATITGNWTPAGSKWPAKAVKRIAHFNETSTSTRWLLCGHWLRNNTIFTDLACVETEIFLHLGGLYIITLEAFKVENFAATFNSTGINSAYGLRQKERSEQDLNVWNFSWIMPPVDPGPLCARNVPIGNRDHVGPESLGDDIYPPKFVACDAPLSGSQILVVARPHGAALALCEIEVFTTPLWTATRASVAFDSSDNDTDVVCGASKLIVEYADTCSNAANPSTCNWTEAWTLTNMSKSVSHKQAGHWAWYQRLFELPFNTSFMEEGTNAVVIPGLREDVAYDIFCWAIDAKNNSIARDLVELQIPWADTHILEFSAPGEATEFGTRRLAYVPNTRTECTPAMRELLPCEERVIPGDIEPPVAVLSDLASIEEEHVDAQRTLRWVATLRIQVQDKSCDNRDFFGIKCTLRCVAFDLDVVPWSTTLDPGGDCSASDLARWNSSSQCFQRRWSNGVVHAFDVKSLLPEHDYWITCEASDPWRNTFEWRETFRTPDSPTPSPTSAPTVSPTRPMNYVTGSTNILPPTRRRRTTPRPTNPTQPGGSQVYPGTPNVPSGAPGPAPRPRPRPPPEPAPVYYAPQTPRPTRKPIAPIPTATSAPTNKITRRPTILIPTPAPRPYVFEMPTTTSTTTPYLASLPDGAMAPSVFNFELVLGVASRSDAYTLLSPSGMGGVSAALRATLGLSVDDSLELVSAKPVQLSRRLSSGVADGGQWSVQVEYVVRSVGGAQALSVYSKVRAMEEDTAGVRQDFSSTLEDEFAKRALPVETPAVRSVGVVSNGSSQRSTQDGTVWKQQASGTRNPATTTQDDEEEEDNNAMSVALYIVLPLTFLICVVVPVGALCSMGLCRHPREEPQKPKLSNTKVACASSVKDAMMEGQMLAALAAERRSKKLMESQLHQACPHRVNVRPARVAWSEIEGEVPNKTLE